MAAAGDKPYAYVRRPPGLDLSICAGMCRQIPRKGQT